MSKENITPEHSRSDGVSSTELLALAIDGARYRAIKELISYDDAGDSMQWANMNWCIDPVYLTPATLDEAIDMYLLS